MNNSEETVRYTVCELFDQLKDALNEKKHIEEMNQRYIGKMQEQQDQIAELKTQLNNMEQCYIGMKKERDELQGLLKEWKGRSLVAIIHGVCRCGEPWQSIISDKEGFNRLHCFNCKHDRYENKKVFGELDEAPRGER